MKLYAYMWDTKELAGETQADENPEWRESDGEEHKWLLPAFTTLTQPPVMLPGFARVYKDGMWVHVKDHRNEIWYDLDGVAHAIDKLGPVPAGWSNKAPTFIAKIKKAIIG